MKFKNLSKGQQTITIIIKIRGIDMSATIKDIAKVTGLSVGTVSKYLNGIKVRPENEKLIEQAVKDLDYKKNYLATSLKTKKTKSIGVIIPSIELTFSGKIVSILENILSLNGYTVIITIVKGSSKIDSQKLKNLERRLLDALIIIPPGDNELLRNWIDEQRDSTPIIILDRVLENDKESIVSYAIVDNKDVSKEAVNIFIENGHKDIAFFGGDKDGYTTRERLRGYKEALQGSKIQIKDELIFFSDFTRAGGYETCKKVFQLPNLPTALFVTNYDMTTGVIEYLNENNIKIGRDISLIGFDLDEMSGLIKPEITMVIQPLEEIGGYAANKILEALKVKSHDFIIKEFNCSIKEGNSVRKIN